MKTAVLTWLAAALGTREDTANLSDVKRDVEFAASAETAAAAAVDWLCLAQDSSASRDGGVSRHFSPDSGWASSYPETTGYIIPTFIAYGKLTKRPELRSRARRMLDWLVSIQLPCGGFQGGLIDSRPIKPVTFNTGQILLGLAAGVREFGHVYRPALQKAADWLVSTQDHDGCWRSFPTQFAVPGEKTFDTHVAWGLLEAARVENKLEYARAGLNNVRWAVGHQRRNGWPANCCLTDNARPLTHTLGYYLRGVVEAHLFSHDETLLAAAEKTAAGVISTMDDTGRIPGRLDRAWRTAVPWTCLTGNVQLALCWLLLYRATWKRVYLEAAQRAMSYVQSKTRLTAPPEIRGAVSGSYPSSGWYCRAEYPNWAAKFFVDAVLLAREIEAPEQAKNTRAKAALF